MLWQGSLINRIKNQGGKMNKKLSLSILAVMLAFGAKGAWAEGPFPAPMTDGYFGPAGVATPNSVGATPGEEVFNAVNSLLGTSYTNNAQIDPLEYTGNASTWQQTGSGGYDVISVGAAATNTLEVYNTNTPGTLISPLGTGFTGTGVTGSGTASSPYIGTASSVFPAGTNFGLAISSAYSSPYNPNGATSTVVNWYSNPALNSDGMDHMLAYNLSSLNGTQMYILDPNTGLTSQVTLENPYLLAFEDMPMTNSVTGAPADLDFNDFTVLVNGVAPVPEPVTVALFGIGLLAMAGFALRRQLPFASSMAFAG